MDMKQLEQAYAQERAHYVENYYNKAEGPRSGIEEDIRTTPLFSLVNKYVAEATHYRGNWDSVLPQYGLLGFHAGDTEGIQENEPIFQVIISSLQHPFSFHADTLLECSSTKLGVHMRIARLRQELHACRYA